MLRFFLRSSVFSEGVWMNGGGRAVLRVRSFVQFSIFNLLSATLFVVGSLVAVPLD